MFKIITVINVCGLHIYNVFPVIYITDILCSFDTQFKISNYFTLV